MVLLLLRREWKGYFTPSLNKFIEEKLEALSYLSSQTKDINPKTAHIPET